MLAKSQHWSTLHQSLRRTCIKSSSVALNRFPVLGKYSTSLQMSFKPSHDHLMQPCDKASNQPALVSPTPVITPNSLGLTCVRSSPVGLDRFPVLSKYSTSLPMRLNPPPMTFLSHVEVRRSVLSGFEASSRSACLRAFWRKSCGCS